LRWGDFGPAHRSKDIRDSQLLARMAIILKTVGLIDSRVLVELHILRPHGPGDATGGEYPELRHYAQDEEQHQFKSRRTRSSQYDAVGVFAEAFAFLQLNI